MTPTFRVHFETGEPVDVNESSPHAARTIATLNRKVIVKKVKLVREDNQPSQGPCASARARGETQ